MGLPGVAIADTRSPTADLAAYALARAADTAGDTSAAVAGYRAALARDPDNAVIAARAYREALVAGDFDLAARAARILIGTDAAPADASVIAYTQAMLARDQAGADAALTAMGRGPLDFVVPVLRAWRNAADPATALAKLESRDQSALARRFALEHRALLEIAAGRLSQGLANIELAAGPGDNAIDLRIAAARLLAGQGDRDRARALIAGDAPLLVAIRADLGRGARPSAEFGTAVLFTRLASDLARAETNALAVTLGRAAIALDPGNVRARLVLAAALSGEGGNAAALDVLKPLTADRDYARLAQGVEVRILMALDRPADALALARKLSEARDASADDHRRYGDLLTGQRRFADAAQAYAAAQAKTQGDDWTLLLQRGGALEQAGRWAEARPLLQRAVELSPQSPLALNYLGYAEADRGENLDGALAMLQRAMALKPDDPAITDSLAWVHYRRGEHAKAVPLLEKAARAEPSDSTIHDHLGDAYWRVGRRYEARYAWRAALAVSDSTEEKARIEAKLRDGLAAATPAS